MNPLWSLALTAIGVLGFWLTGSGRWQGWAINLGSQVLWVTYAVVTEQYWFIVGAGFYGGVFLRNLLAARATAQPVVERTPLPHENAWLSSVELIESDLVPSNTAYLINPNLLVVSPANRPYWEPHD